jgi:hypothetical protein
MPDKIQQLLEITDAPNEFSEEQIEETLKDDDMRAAYAVMVLAAQTFDAARENERQNVLQNVAKTIAMGNRRMLWRKVAIFIGIFLISGLAVAAFLPMGKTKPKEEKQEVVEVKETPSQTADSDVRQKDLNVTQTSQPAIVVFQDETLENIMQAVGEAYKVTPVFKNEQKRHLRLHLKWNRDAGLDIFLQRISQFKQFEVTATPTTLIIE